MQFSDRFNLYGFSSNIASLAGKTMRHYTGGLGSNRNAEPVGTLLAEITLPIPAHNEPFYDSGRNLYIATKTGTWQQLKAINSGNVGCFAILDGEAVLLRGTVGTQAQKNANPDAIDMTVDIVKVTKDAPYVVETFTIQKSVS